MNNAPEYTERTDNIATLSVVPAGPEALDEDIFKSCIQGSDVTLERPLVD